MGEYNLCHPETMDYSPCHPERKRRIFSSHCPAFLACAVLLLLIFSVPASAADDTDGDYIEISTAEELMNMNADGSYRLITDINLDGYDWKPMIFNGKLDGNGCAILNATIKDTGNFVRKTYDGNMIEYDTSFTGFFEILEDGAEVKNLTFLNLRVDVDTDKPCFAGGIAGYMEAASIKNCSLQGIISLKAHEKMFGVGGIIGYGCGSIENTKADVTLVNIDTDATTKDEQFMGGACAAGYPDVKDCDITIMGYDSDHGYVHDGGLIGMYIFYPRGLEYHGTIARNHVTGKIRFFEDNTNRRAYCKGFIGEILIWEFDNIDNYTEEFERDEIFTYDKDILPHECDAPDMEEIITEPSCEFGYTTYKCKNCGYTETDHYTMKKHSFEWTVVKEPTESEEGYQTGVCSICGVKGESAIPRIEVPEGVTLLEPEEEPLPVVVEEVTPAADEEPAEEKKKGGAGIIIATVLILAGGSAAAFWFFKKRR